LQKCSNFFLLLHTVGKGLLHSKKVNKMDLREEEEKVEEVAGEENCREVVEGKEVKEEAVEEVVAMEAELY